MEKNEERIKIIERVAKKFIALQEPEQMYIAGYIARVEEEQAKKKKKEGATA